ncbi:xanthine dehydrogenase family protein molybdopterin-binding subunit [Candidatus Solirubrobacter pratensis]|uniref:xanthine dehydrogenase family protein molybdopterin-binding subunit n=1 Tax=Candidatus Solirubrobacter pratensis TaxID=1298857 RepID=UPI0003F67BB0|nr:molybdopterin cofactor-binding domain-containing protein [Candidatus Solirubrobacter pratensis]
MTETLMETGGVNRRAFLAGTGAMFVAASLPRLLNPKTAFAALEDSKIGPALVDPTLIDSWLAVHGDGTVTIFTGKVELGTGVLTTTMQLVADELDVSLSALKVVEGDTWMTPDQGYTAGSQSNKTQYAAKGGLRQAAAEARLALLGMASARLGAPVANLSVEDGVVISGGGGQVSYGELIGDQKFNLKITGKATPKRFDNYKVVGTNVPRVDIPAKATGKFTYTQDVRIAGMLHARVVRPPTLDSKLLKVVGFPGHRKPPGFVALVVKNNFVAVVAEREEQAIDAAQALELSWQTAALPSFEHLYGDLQRQTPTTDRVLIDTHDVDAALAGAAKSLQVNYRYPIQMHGSMGASAAVASVEGQSATVWSSTQGVYPLRSAIAVALGLPEPNVHVIYVEGSGCYGINGADNSALDAAVISQQVGKPVRVQYMRADEHKWENFGQPYLHQMRGGIDANGKVVAWDYVAWTASRGGRPGPPANIPTGILLGLPEDPLPKSPAPTPSSRPNTVDNSNSAPSYLIPSQRLRSHTGKHAFMAGPLRSPNRIQNTWANESFMDELAHLANRDPVEFRLAHLADRRLTDVIRLAAYMAGWKPRPAATKIDEGRYKRGRGIAAMFYEGNNGYNAAVFGVTVDTKTGKVTVDDVWSAQDCGPVLNPDGMRAQAEGCLMQTISRSLIEEVKWGPDGITSADWDSYPVIRFNAMPKLHFRVIDRKGADVMGAGEVLITNGPAAIANAIFDATGKRIRQVPFTPARIRRMLAE